MIPLKLEKAFNYCDSLKEYRGTITIPRKTMNRLGISDVDIKINNDTPRIQGNHVRIYLKDYIYDEFVVDRGYALFIEKIQVADLDNVNIFITVCTPPVRCIDNTKNNGE